MNEINIGTLLIAESKINTEEEKRIISLAKQKNIKIVYVKEGQIIKLDNNTYLDILFIGKDTVNLNNASIIARLRYNNFSMLFTGDCEKEEETEFIEKYKNQNINADILKVAHHGSSTSSTINFIQKIKPKIALIGVGKNNSFGHPSAEVEQMLKEEKCKIFRTDLNGEIVIEIKKDGTINTSAMF